MNSMHSPFQCPEATSSRKAGGQCGQAWQNTLTTVIYVPEFQNQSVFEDGESTQQSGSANPQNEGLVGQDKLIQVLVRQTEQFVCGVTLEEQVTHP